MTLTLNFFFNLDAFLLHLWAFKAWLADFYPDKLSIDLSFFFLWRPLFKSTTRRSKASKTPRRRAYSGAGIRSQKRVKPKPNRSHKLRSRRKCRSKSKPLKVQKPRRAHNWNPTLPITRRKKLKTTLIKGFRRPYARTMKHTAYLKNKAGDLLAVSFEGDCHAATAWCPLCEGKCPHSESASGASHSVELALSKISCHLRLSHDLHGFELDLPLSKL
jgi:hypothetical protein